MPAAKYGMIEKEGDIRRNESRCDCHQTAKLLLSGCDLKFGRPRTKVHYENAQVSLT
jgi:hypothetical protein